jgi:hypothetical protein
MHDHTVPARLEIPYEYGDMVFEFRELEQAKDFVAAVKKSFDLDGQIVTRKHPHPTIVYMDHPYWSERLQRRLRAEAGAWAWGSKAREIERLVKNSARMKFGGSVYCPEWLLTSSPIPQRIRAAIQILIDGAKDDEAAIRAGLTSDESGYLRYALRRVRHIRTYYLKELQACRARNI